MKAFCYILQNSLIILEKIIIYYTSYLMTRQFTTSEFPGNYLSLIMTGKVRIKGSEIQNKNSTS